MTTLGPAVIDFLKGKNHKEQCDMILEPLQVMITLALLGFSPIGTKIYISQNTLYLHKPVFYQGIVRWWEGDSKDDLYYLFHAIRRYYKWYKKDVSVDDNSHKIYNFVLELAKVGLRNLIKTYQKSDKKSILHTLSLYSNILDLETPHLFDGTLNENSSSINIDQVFENVVKLYDRRILVAIFNLLRLIKSSTNENDVVLYIEGINKVLIPTQNLIRNWIQQNLTI